jgi:hypothetical protein
LAGIRLRMTAVPGAAPEVFAAMVPFPPPLPGSPRRVDASSVYIIWDAKAGGLSAKPGGKCFYLDGDPVYIERLAARAQRSPRYMGGAGNHVEGEAGRLRGFPVNVPETLPDGCR